MLRPLAQKNTLFPTLVKEVFYCVNKTHLICRCVLHFLFTQKINVFYNVFSVLIKHISFVKPFSFKKHIFSYIKNKCVLQWFFNTKKHAFFYTCKKYVLDVFFTLKLRKMRCVLPLLVTPKINVFYKVFFCTKKHIFLHF